ERRCACRIGGTAPLSPGRQIADMVPDNGRREYQQRVRYPQKPSGNYKVPMALLVAMCLVTIIMPMMMVFPVKSVMTMLVRVVNLLVLVVSIMGTALNVNVRNVISGMAVP